MISFDRLPHGCSLVSAVAKRNHAWFHAILYGMKHAHLIIVILLTALLINCQNEDHNDAGHFSGDPTGLLPEENDFYHAEGRLIVDGSGTPYTIRGVAFGNNVWANPATPPANHHGEIDYQRAAAMGFNSVRFYINYGIFEDDAAPYAYKQSGFDWIDRNIAWAKAHGITLIVNMHCPQGGFQSNGAGDALWNSPSNQLRFTALWKEIARRYADEPAILGWDLLNEPVVTKSLNQWRELAAETTWHIRQVDPKHLILVERVNANKGHAPNIWDPNQNGEMNFFLLNDRNVMYEFHTYVPMAFTHQGASWIEAMKGVDSVWPDPYRLESPGALVWSSAASANPLIQTGTSDWTWHEGVPYTITDPVHKVGRIALLGNNLGAGTVLLDDVVLTESAPDGTVLRSMNFGYDTKQNYYYWSKPVRGSGTWSPDEGRSGSGCLRITGSGAEAVLTDDSNGVILTQGNSWTVSGWMKGVSVPAGARARLRLDLYAADREVHIWDTSYLEEELDRYVAFGERHGVPLYLGEFGCIRQAFEGGRGGCSWVGDILDICQEKSLNYNYHTWHEENFGIWTNSSDLPPADPNQPLIDLFTEKQIP